MRLLIETDKYVFSLIWRTDK